VRQQAQLDLLQRELRNLRDLVATLAPGGPTGSGPEPPPPHY